MLSRRATMRIEASLLIKSQCLPLVWRSLRLLPKGTSLRDLKRSLPSPCNFLLMTILLCRVLDHRVTTCLDSKLPQACCHLIPLVLSADPHRQAASKAPSPHRIIHSTLSSGHQVCISSNLRLLHPCLTNKCQPSPTGWSINRIRRLKCLKISRR